MLQETDPRASRGSCRLRSGTVTQLVCLAMAVCSCALSVDLAHRVLFLATFDGGLAADVARGGGAPAVAGKTSPVPGVMGKGIRMDEAVAFATAGNLVPNSGTISFFVRPAAPLIDPKKNYPMLRCAQGRVPRKLLNALQIYCGFTRSTSRWDVRFLLTDDSRISTDISVIVFPDAAKVWREDSSVWKQVTVSWNVAEMLIAVDGKVRHRGRVSAGKPVKVPRVLAETFSLESGFCFDQLVVLDSALNEEQILSLHKRKGHVNMERAPLTAPLFPVPPRTKPPRLDGRVDDVEWGVACSVEGFLGLTSKVYSHRQGRVWLAYDATRIYFAYRSHFPPGTQEGGAWDEKALRCFAKDRDGKVFLDDSLELYFAPEDPSRYIQFIGNCEGAVNDRRYGDISWNGDWTYQCYVDDEAGLWEAEGAVTFASLGVPSPQPGDVWHFNAARNWKGMEDLLTSLTGEYRKLMARIVFTDGACVVQERSWGQPTAGLPASRVSVSPRDGGTMKIREEWGVTRATGEAVSDTAGHAVWAAGGDATELPKPTIRVPEEGAYVAYLSLRDDASGMLMYERDVPFCVSKPVSLEPYYVLKTSTLGVLTDLTGLPLNPLKDGLKLDYVVTGSDGGVLARRTVEGIEKVRFGVEFDASTPVLAGMPVSIACCFTASDGTTFEASDDYRVPPVPEWSGAYDPPEDFVPWPWSPVQVDADRGVVRCGQRVYQFGSSPLPVSVRVGERELLAGPVALTLRVAEQAVRWDDDSITVAKSTPASVSLSKSGTGAGVGVVVSSTVEYDGYVECRVTLTPHEPVSVSELTIGIPLRGECVEFFHVNGKWGDKLFGAVTERDAFPVLKDERHYYWLGDDRTGLCWLAEDFSDWRPGAGRRRIGFEQDGDAWLAVLRPLGEERRLEGPLVFTFAFQATPTRPPAERRMRGLLAYNMPPERFRFPASKIGDTVFEMSLKGKMNYPPWPAEADMIRTWIAGHKAKGMRFTSYQYIDAGTETEAYTRYWGDWVTTVPAETMQWRTRTAKCCLATSWSDYYCSVLDTMMQEFDADGVYLDGVMARSCSRGVAHGHQGMADWPLSAARAHFKKLLYVARKNKGEKSVLFGHVSLGTVAPIVGLLDLHLKGENYGSPLDYDALTPDVMRAEFGRQWGPQSIILPQLTKKQAIPAGRFLGLIALHDVDCAPSWLPPKERQKMLLPMWSIFEDFRIDQATFHPYWEQSLFREAGGNPISFYAHAERGDYLVVVANQTAGAVRLAIAAGEGVDSVGGLARTERLLSGRKAAWHEGQLALDLDPWEYDLIRIGSAEGEGR